MSIGKIFVSPHFFHKGPPREVNLYKVEIILFLHHTILVVYSVRCETRCIRNQLKCVIQSWEIIRLVLWFGTFNFGSRLWHNVITKHKWMFSRLCSLPWQHTISLGIFWTTEWNLAALHWKILEFLFLPMCLWGKGGRPWRCEKFPNITGYMFGNIPLVTLTSTNMIMVVI